MAALAACGTTDDPITPPPTAPSLTLSLSAPALTMRAGDQGLVQVILTRANLDQIVRLTVSDLPADVSGSFTVPTLPAGSVASTLMLASTRETEPGTYTAIVTASAQGVNAQALPLSITITPAPTIALEAKPDSLSVIAGGSNFITLDISRTDYLGSVSFEAEGAPAGVTTSFPDSPTTGSLATAAFSVSSDVLPGVYIFAINAIAQNLPVVNAFVQLTVLPAFESEFEVTVNPAILSMMQGQQASATVSVDRADYEGDVTFSAAGLPQGVVATFSPQITEGNTSTVTFFVSGNTPAGNFPLTVTASGTGSLTSSTNLDLMITELPRLALMAEPESLTVTAGDSVQGVLSLLRTNLPGAVQLSVTGLPVGVTLRLPENPTLASSLPLTFVVEASATPGSWFITIHAAALGVPAVDATFTVTVLPPAPPP